MLRRSFKQHQSRRGGTSIVVSLPKSEPSLNTSNKQADKRNRVELASTDYHLWYFDHYIFQYKIAFIYKSLSADRKWLVSGRAPNQSRWQPWFKPSGLRTGLLLTTARACHDSYYRHHRDQNRAPNLRWCMLKCQMEALLIKHRIGQAQEAVWKGHTGA